MKTPTAGRAGQPASAFLSHILPGLTRPVATSVGGCHVMPPSMDFETRMLIGPDGSSISDKYSEKNRYAVPSGATIGSGLSWYISSASGSAGGPTKTGLVQVSPPSREVTIMTRGSGSAFWWVKPR